MLSRTTQMYQITSSILTDLPPRLRAICPADGVEVILKALQDTNPYEAFEVSELDVWGEKAKVVAA